MATIRYFAAAAEAAGTAEEEIPGATLAELTAAMEAGRDAHFAAVLARCSWLLDGARVDDPTTAVAPGARLDVLPPFAGG